MTQNENHQTLQAEAPEEQELRRLRGNPRYPKYYLLKWNEPFMFKRTFVFKRSKQGRPRWVKLPKKHVLNILTPKEKGLPSVFWSIGGILITCIVVLVLLAGLNILMTDILFLAPEVSLPIFRGCMIVLPILVLWTYFHRLPERSITVDEEKIAIKYHYAHLWGSKYGVSSDLWEYPRMGEHWRFENLHYCRVEKVRLSGRQFTYMRIVHHGKIQTFIGIPSDYYAHLVTYVLRKYGVAVREAVLWNNIYEMMNADPMENIT